MILPRRLQNLLAAEISQFRLNFTPSAKGRRVQGRPNQGGQSTPTPLLSLQGSCLAPFYDSNDPFTGWRQAEDLLRWADLLQTKLEQHFDPKRV